MTLTNIQREVLIGTLLGDGYLEINGSEARLQVLHSIKQKEYVDWQYQIFKKWTKSPPQPLGKGDYRFRTITHPELTRYYTVFYPTGRKIVPDNIADILTSPLSLAVWFMDDGKRRPDCRGFFFDTLSFSLDDQERLQKCLAQNFALVDTRLHWNGDGYHIYVSARHANQFRQLIQDYVIPSMKYKLP